ncbi:MAG: hypothetical protein J7L46_02655 [Bacteroidales bacterium]|nr:hypothetical protein [Bacteroidales bacterium]
MKRDDDFQPSDQHISSLIKRFEMMMVKSENAFFDMEEFMDIISYYTDNYQYNKALQVVVMAEKQYPFSTEILLMKANVLFKKDKKSEAIKILKGIEPLEGQNPELHFLKGNILIHDGKIPEAMKSYKKSLKVSDEEDIDTFLFSISGYLMSNEYFKEALVFLEQLIGMGYDDEDVLNDISLCYEKIKDYKKSARYMRKILEDNPFDEIMWDYLGGLYLKDNRQDKALEAFFFAFALDEESYASVEHISEIFQQKGDTENALKYYYFLLSKHPEEVYYHLSVADIFVQTKKIGKAKEHYLVVLDKEPKNPEAFYGISRIEFEKRSYNKALDMIYVALLYDKDNPAYNNFRGKIRLALGQKEKALDDLEKGCRYSDTRNDFCRDYLALLVETEFVDMLDLLSSLLHSTKAETKMIIVDFLLQNDVFDADDSKELNLNEMAKYLIDKFLSKEK